MLLRLVNGLARRFRLGFLRGAALGGLFLPVAVPLAVTAPGCTTESSQDALPLVDAAPDRSVAPSVGAGGTSVIDSGTGGQRITQDAPGYGRCGIAAVDCFGECVDTDVDLANCGSCGTPCAAGLVCSGGTCRLNCMVGQVNCGGRCIYPLSDDLHCGATDGCGAVARGDAATGGASFLDASESLATALDASVDVSVADGGSASSAGVACESGQKCTNGVCRVECQQGQVNCEGKCIDPKSNNKFCGAAAGCLRDGGTAGMQCAAGQICSNGTCQLTCQDGLVNCGGTCVNPATDNAFCGATADCGLDGGTAGVRCKTGELCSAGKCEVSCQSSYVTCDGTCVDPMSSTVHCGATSGCGADAGIAGAVCLPGEICSSGVCRALCPQGQVQCNGSCIDPLGDPNYCGASGGCAVDAGTAGTVCVNGHVCAAGTCQETCGSLIECGGRCIDPTTSHRYCGASTGCGADGGTSGTACTENEVCNRGTCQLSCRGLLVCDGQCVDPMTDRFHCGASGACEASAGTAGTTCESGYVCNGGHCQLSCQQGLVNCEGHCVDPATNRQHCGASEGCGTEGGTRGEECAPNKVCSGGTCLVNCPQGFIECAGTCIDPDSNPTYCGATGSCTGSMQGFQCSVPDQVCTGGRCELFCPTNLVLCNGTCIDPKEDRNHCGASGDCNGTHQGQECLGGQVCTPTGCQLSCPSGLVNCGGSCIDPDTNANYCGASDDCSGAHTGVPCQLNQICLGGTCQAAGCSPPFIDCGSICIDPSTNLSHCGASDDCSGSNAGADCLSLGQMCSSGICQPDCQTGQVACGGHCVDPTTSLSNCGATDGCGVGGRGSVGATCGSGQVCATPPGSSTPSCRCAAGLTNCTTSCADLTNDENNCGSCNHACGANETCEASTCTAPPYGTGSDGTLNVTSTTTINQIAAPCGGTAGTRTLTIGAVTSGTFAMGQNVLVHQTQGSSNAGFWELATVDSVAGSTITLTHNLVHTYTSTGGSNHAQVIVVPQYTTVQVSGTLTAPAWGGTTGGILVLEATGNVTVSGTVSMASKGYRGANHTSTCHYQCDDTSNVHFGTSGESLLGPGTQSSTANASGGGGGVGGRGCGQAAGGSYSSVTLGTDGPNLISDWGGCHWSTPSPRDNAAHGLAVGTDDLTQQILFGGAGGEGGSDPNGAYPGAGGNGGGIVIIISGGSFSISGAGKIDVNGDQGGNGVQNVQGTCAGGDIGGPGMAGGGGGAGGAVRILTAGSATLGTGAIMANGSQGGLCSTPSESRRAGSGGSGRIAVKAGTTPAGTTSPAYFGG